MNHNIFSSLILPFSLLIKNLFIIIIIINLTFLLLQDHYFVGAVDQYYLNCSLPARTCGDNQTIRFPFYLRDQQNPYCGYPGFEVSCDEDGHSILNLFVNDPYIVRHISYEKRSLIVSNAAISHNSTPNCIPPLQNISFPNERFKLPKQNQVFLLSDCSPPRVPEYEIGCSSENATNWILGVPENEKEQLGNLSKKCGDGKVVVMPVKDYDSSDDESVGMRQVLSRGFELTWKADDCSRCQNSGGVCGFNTSSYLFQCYCEDRPHRVRCQGDGGSRKWKLGLGIGVGFLGLFLIAIFIICCYKKRRASSNIFSRSTTDPYLNTDVEGGSCYFGVPVFPFNDLAKATNNFASEKELGDGGFGSVYHGKLKDGREVAVKRLYEHNYKRVEQFMNEIEILTRLRHRNLVSLYGCTSRHSRELLLVYEYIPNGTVADHLHGEQAKPGLLPWSIRMSIAIETATALAYLHASEIVHRDVKTNNILLDNNFTVKVADFGLSRLFPNDVTHVSTAPQGTPGYVDPEYHQCYQLTSKSDVYSFGVVLIELISSLPAVDITRHRHEINLANLATSKIQKCEFHELIDPSTGFETDSEVRRMTIAVAELAFQCLQQNKEMRPSMEEVLETLKSIESREDSPDENQEKEFDDIRIIKSEQPPPPSPECDEVGLLKNMRPPASPISVTHKWPSTRSITPNVSG
ncbi:LEAF RUST 10 DISEASE-RESISTANCE LOCUS RECEPTOR-LIKE PROTEIN KINASE-like 1.2 isoform X2 [Ziziphus jujuba]|uniref:non-specific serine/threonine protein kinase n=1 Tax=Ziziphus jujuba TaxID=326968 RepID=A0ABM3ZXX2_ZIZJJ|nr:LEAF RUST 10 DISEASE-RESISTANCE LOCUS RECEPTOR-LIKE PROTEIN KINASE-like 1.2 isoform X2 [Ziziphus jujuba]